MDTLLISVIIPFYKRIDFLKEALHSILVARQQEFDLEVILIDDCSPEKLSKTDIEQYASQGLNLSVFENEFNAGPGVSRMNGLQRANGKYVHFMDSDDLISPDFYKKLLALFERDSGLSMVYGYSQYYDGESILNTYKRKQSINHHLLDCLVEHGRVWSTSACLWRTETAIASQGWKPGVWEDYYFDVAVGLINPRINAVPENLILYRIHQDIRFSTVNSIEKHWSRLSTIYRIRTMIVKLKANKKYRDWITLTRNRHLLWALNATTKETLWYSFSCLIKLDVRFIPLLFLSKANRWRILK